MMPSMSDQVPIAFARSAADAVTKADGA